MYAMNCPRCTCDPTVMPGAKRHCAGFVPSSVPGVSIAALCDVVKEKVLRVQTRLDRAGKASQKIALYTDGDHAYEQLVKTRVLKSRPCRRSRWRPESRNERRQHAQRPQRRLQTL